MGWQAGDLHDFTIRGKRYAVPSDEDFGAPVAPTSGESLSASSEMIANELTVRSA